MFELNFDSSEYDRRLEVTQKHVLAQGFDLLVIGQIVFGQSKVRLELFRCGFAVKSSVSCDWVIAFRIGLIDLHLIGVTKLRCGCMF